MNNENRANKTSPTTILELSEVFFYNLPKVRPAITVEFIHSVEQYLSGFLPLPSLFSLMRELFGGEVMKFMAKIFFRGMELSEEFLMINGLTELLEITFETDLQMMERSEITIDPAAFFVTHHPLLLSPSFSSSSSYSSTSSYSPSSTSPYPSLPSTSSPSSSPSSKRTSTQRSPALPPHPSHPSTYHSPPSHSHNHFQNHNHNHNNNGNLKRNERGIPAHFPHISSSSLSEEGEEEEFYSPTLSMDDLDNDSLFPITPKPRRQKKNRWSPEEIDLLEKLVQEQGRAPRFIKWKPIVEKINNTFHGGKTSQQAAQHYKRTMGKTKFNDWSIEEEELMLKKVKEFGVNKWASIAAFLPDRSDIQCRYHFNRFYRSPFGWSDKQIEKMKEMMRKEEEDNKDDKEVSINWSEIARALSDPSHLHSPLQTKLKWDEIKANLSPLPSPSPSPSLSPSSSLSSSPSNSSRQKIVPSKASRATSSSSSSSSVSSTPSSTLSSTSPSSSSSSRKEEGEEKEEKKRGNEEGRGNGEKRGRITFNVVPKKEKSRSTMTTVRHNDHDTDEEYFP